MISDLNRLTELFSRMREDGFDTSKPLLWGFYFISSYRDRLNKVFDELKQHSYELQSLEKINTKEWKLTVNKIDTLTPEKLHKRNIAFNELANHYAVELYDGWDVEKLPVNQE